MAPAIRVFPVLAVAASLLLGVKAVGLLTGFKTGIGDAVAENRKPVEQSDAPKPAASKAKSELPPELSDPNAMSPAEIAVLQSLAQRRNELDARQREQDMREQLMAATEKKVNERIGELKVLEERIVGLLGARDKEAEAQLASLVRIYESMKPKDAAKIFEKLEDRVLLDVAQRMKAPKIGAILAEMDPARAQSVTVQLATRLQLPKEAAMTPDEHDDERPTGSVPIRELPGFPQESQPKG